MPQILADPLPPGCPWSGWTPPNVDWCEAERCTWIVNPADTWSNLAYLVFGIAMIVWLRRDPPARSSPLLSLFGPASILVGVFSGIYHASYTYFFQFFDFVGMFVFCFAVITANALRLGWVGTRARWAFFGAGVLAMSAMVPLVSETPVPIQSLVGLLIAVILGQEWWIHARRAPHAPSVDYVPFRLALCALAAAALFSALDVTRAWCDPDSLLQGHALWHLLSAASLVALFAFYARLPAPAPATAAPAHGS